MARCPQPGSRCIVGVEAPVGAQVTRDPYPTDLTDAEWAQVAPLIPPPKGGGRPRDVDLREVLNAAIYRHRGGCSWRLLPYEFPPWQTVYTYVRQWRQAGIWARILVLLEERDEAYRGACGASARRGGSLPQGPGSVAGSAAAATSPHPG